MFVTSDYLEAVANSSRFVFDKSNGRSYPLRSLFLMQRLGAGQDAFDRKADVLEKAVFDLDEALEIERQKVRQMIPNRIFDQLDDQTENESARQKRLQETKRMYAFSRKSSIGESDSLFKEGSIVLSGKLLFCVPTESRVIVIAKAGFGKTTLLKRVSLALSDKTPETLAEDASFLASIEEDSLEQLIPCTIFLRNASGDLSNLDKLIIRSVSEAMSEDDETEASRWLNTIRSNQLVLLIDGLDELSTDSVKAFLTGLGIFLEKNPETRIIMTTRVSGIETEEVQDCLRELHFHGRAILPLNDREATRLCEKYASLTENHPNVMKNFERIQSETSFGYLHEFTRSPLELLMLLKYLPAQSGSVVNRWDLFYAVLRAKITSHIELKSKESIFKDEIKFLSFISFQMQLQNKSSLTIEEIEALIPSVEQISFYTNLFDTSLDDPSLTIELIWQHIKHISHDIDVIEIGNSRALSMPIRANQEFLAAYAVLNLCLLDKEDYPDPLVVLSPYFSDPKWLGVIEFAVAGLESLELEEKYDAFLSGLYASDIEMISLNDLIDNDYYCSTDVARELFKARLKRLVLEKEEKQLIYRIMKTKSATNYRDAVISLFEDSIQGESDLLYLEAAAYTCIFAASEKQLDPISMAIDCLKSKKPHENAIGAEILVLLARVQLQEEPFELESFDSCQWEIPKEACSILTELAIETHSFIFVSALTELYVSTLIEETIIHPYLTRQLLDIAIDELNRCLSVFSFTSIPLLRHSKSETVSHLKDVINSIGLFPFELSDSLGVNDLDETPQAFVKSFFEEPNQDAGIDSIALTISEYHLIGSKEMLQKHWNEEVARVRGMLLLDGEEHLSKRSNNHYHLVKNSFEDIKKKYNEQVLNIYSYLFE